MDTNEVPYRPPVQELPAFTFWHFFNKRGKHLAMLCRHKLQARRWHNCFISNENTHYKTILNHFMERNTERFPEQEAPRKNTDKAFVQVGEDGKPSIPDGNEKEEQGAEEEDLDKES